MLNVFWRRCRAWLCWSQPYSLNASMWAFPFGVNRRHPCRTAAAPRPPSASRSRSAAATLSRRLAPRQSREDLKLLLLHLHQLDPLLIADLVQLRVQRDDLQFGFGIHLIVVLDVDPIVCRLPILAHHNDRRL